MKVYTSLKAIPELSNLASNDRNELWNRHASKALFSWQTLLAFLFLLLFTAVGVEFRFYLKGEFPQIHWRYIDYPIMVCTYALGFLAIFQVQVRLVRLSIKKSCTENR